MMFRYRGFSYIEILVTLAILALMATVAVPYLDLVITRKNEAELRQDLRMLREAIDAFKKASDEGRLNKKVGESGYPKSLDDLVNGIEDSKDPAKHKIYFLRRLPRDPMYIGPDVSAAGTWGLRSYDSPPDQPREGADVFDIYSKSEKKGLDGVPYNKW